MKRKTSIKISLIAIALLSLTFASLEVLKSNKKTQKWDNREAMIKALKWQEENPIFAKGPADWTNGAYYAGVYKAHQATNDKIYLDALTSMADRNEWKPGERFYHADDLIICASYLYLKSNGIESVNLQPTETILNDHLFQPHDWKNGNKNTIQPILWWWCDALFMAPPVLTYYSKVKSDPRYLDMMHKHFMETYELLFDHEENLFARDLIYVWKSDSTDVKEPNGKKVFWSRGNGWVMAGLALTMENMPVEYEFRPFYENLFKTMASRLLELQPEDGLWRTSLLCPESFKHGEVSGSGFHTFALTWGINNGLLDKALYEPAVRKAWNGLRECQKPNGMVGWVQNIGAAPEPATKDSWQNFGTGAFLLAGSEIMKLDKSMD